ncbi:MAG: DEAD/DEAH box helicase [Vitreoscilla sp.]|nr:DEAD/DEAH box helicase [Vitreoscilla sp.]
MSGHAAAWAALSPLQREVLGAMALGATPRQRGWVLELLADPALRETGSPKPTDPMVRAAQAALHEAGWLSEGAHRGGALRVDPRRLAEVSARLLARVPLERLRHALARADGYPQQAAALGMGGRFASVEVAVAWLRLETLGGASLDFLETQTRRLPWGVDGMATLLDHALGLGLDDTLFARLHPGIQRDQLMLGFRQWDALWLPPEGLHLQALAETQLRADHSDDSFLLRWAMAEHALLVGEAARLPEILAPTIDDAMPDGLPGRQALYRAFVAAGRVVAGQWGEAEQGFDEALTVLRKATGKRRALLPPALGTAYAMALLAERRPTALHKALKFALSEGGSREPMLDSPYGFIALALQMHLGERPRDLQPFRPARHLGSGQASPLDLWRWLMRAWLKQGAQAEPLSPAEAQSAADLATRLREARLPALEALFDGAMRVLGGESAPPGFFIGGAQERWQVALAALQAVAQPEGAAGPAEAGATRLLWLLRLDRHGRPEELLPHEQKRGPRGWGKPKPVPLVRLQRSAEALAPQDVAVAHAIRQERFGHALRFDLALAVGGLVGHPSMAFDDAPDTLVELSEAAPELDVQPEGADRLRVRMLPTMALAPEEASPRWAANATEQKELEALKSVCVLRDSPQRARLVRLTPSQRRVAQLLGPSGLDVPRQGAALLQEVLSGLGSHFRIHTDDESAGPVAARELPADSRLRAELVPVGDGLQLRLVAAPFGADYRADGPRLIPGNGRPRVVATLRNESLGVQRDLARERAHLEAVLDACPLLPAPDGNAPCEWSVDTAEQALALVEALHRLPDAVALDWPQGRPLRVETAGLGQLVLRVHTRQEWLAVQGELKVDEELVLSLQQLVGSSAGPRSRFVPLGEGRYLALTQELRERLDDLAAVAEASRAKGEDLAALRIPSVAAPWLRDVLQGTQVEHDAAFATRLARLDEAQRLVPAVPATLQARLRPYQEEGVEWALRLAHAGLGACLADDMGLGKTLQALAVLLARAAAGPALVVAPTSLMGNWRAEARRFAPSLSVSVYGEEGASADRSAALAEARAGQVVLVSYALLQIDGEAFAGREWATLVLDEAQAIKNAAAKRSQAVFALKAGFRMALSGTPIENRLAELWSIMRACNPGLLGSAARFGERFAGPIERQQDKRAQRQLRRLIAPFILRRTKAQVLDDLPPRTELVLRVEGDAAEQAHYEALRRDALMAAERSLAGDAPGQSHLNILAGLTRLRRAACDPRLVSPQLARPGPKVRAFAELAAELVANGHKALVFSQFVDFLALLREPLDAAGIAYQYLDGSTPMAERTRRVDAFQAGQGELFLISLKAGGFGLNLTVADYVVIADPWWNPAAEDQASGRAHRIGQQRPVTVYRLVNAGTLEERILTLHHDKRELANLLLDATGTRSALPPADELMALMRGDDDTAALYE